MYKKIATLGDQHQPFIDKKCDAVTRGFLIDFKPDVIVLNGDLIDLYKLSSFDKNPSRKNTILEDCKITKEYLTQLRDEHPNAEIVYNFGNHEDRMRKIVWKVVPQFNGILRLEQILELDKLHIKYNIRANDVYQDGILLTTHGTIVRKDSGMTARAMLQKYGMSVIHNHTHRLGSVFWTHRGGTIGAWENACQCSLTLARTWGMTYPPNWQQGLSVTFMKGKRFIVNQILIYKGSLLFGGEEWKV